MATEEKLTNSQILACLYHISENVKSRLGLFLKSKIKTSEEKDSDSYIFICSTCDKLRSCRTSLDMTLCSEAGITCEDEEMNIEEPEIVLNADSSTEYDQDTFEILYNSNIKENISWYKLWDNISLYIYIYIYVYIIIKKYFNFDI